VDVFPFGEPVRRVEQRDRTPKRVFVLGVYASAVHARWLDQQGKTRVAALAVASEPYIFWRGDGAEQIISRIRVPQALGRLLPAAPNLNGPSGIALDVRFLAPLHLTRNEAWLCDLLPQSYLNPKQQAAIERAYLPVAAQYGLPAVTLPAVPSQLADDQRRREIASELAESQAEVVLLLGDEPIRWFLQSFDKRWRALSDFGRSDADYGRLHEVKIGGRIYQALPLVHPRQAGALGAHSGDWRALHERWTTRAANIVKS
jgi:hypothetical protein